MTNSPPPIPPAAGSPRPDERGMVDPASGLDAAGTAGELFAHGLLHTLAHRDRASDERRVSRVMEAIGAQTRAERRGPYTFPRAVRWSLAAAAMLVIGTVIVMLGVPGESTAMAAMQQTIKAMQNAGDRRYEIRILSWTDDQPSDAPLATVDTRSPGLIVINDRPPWRTERTYVGSDAKGPWSIRSDGSIERERPFSFWPPWATIDGTSIFAGSVDGLLAELPRTYTLTRLAPATLDADSGAPAAVGAKRYDRISARRTKPGGHQPPQIDLWIDPDTRLADRIEFHWDPPATGSDGSDDAQPAADDRGPGFDDHDRNVGDRPPPPPPPPHDHPHDHDDADRPPPDGDGPSPPGPPPGAADDRPPRHAPPPSSGDRDDRRAPGSPKPRGGRGTPKLVIFQRVDAPQLPENWFTPEGHQR